MVGIGKWWKMYLLRLLCWVSILNFRVLHFPPKDKLNLSTQLRICLLPLNHITFFVAVRWLKSYASPLTRKERKPQEPTDQLKESTGWDKNTLKLWWCLILSISQLLSTRFAAYLTSSNHRFLQIYSLYVGYISTNISKWLNWKVWLNWPNIIYL